MNAALAKAQQLLLDQNERDYLLSQVASAKGLFDLSFMLVYLLLVLIGKNLSTKGCTHILEDIGEFVLNYGDTWFAIFINLIVKENFRIIFPHIQLFW